MSASGGPALLPSYAVKRSGIPSRSRELIASPI